MYAVEVDGVFHDLLLTQIVAHQPGLFLYLPQLKADAAMVALNCIDPDTVGECWYEHRILNLVGLLLNHGKQLQARCRAVRPHLKTVKPACTSRCWVERQ